MNLHNNNKPLVRLGQGEYARGIYPRDLERSSLAGEGRLLGVLLLASVYFIAGLLLGAWLW